MNALGRLHPGGAPQMGTLTRVGSVHGGRPERLRARMPSVGSEAGAELLRSVWGGKGRDWTGWVADGSLTGAGWGGTGR